MYTSWTKRIFGNVSPTVAAYTAALATNAASSDPHWPGVLDLIRRYPWIVLPISLIATFALERFRNGGRLSDEFIGQQIIQYNFGDVAIHQGDSKPRQEIDEEPSPNYSTTIGENEINIQEPVILYAASSFLENDGWEDKFRQKISEEAPEAICVPLDLTQDAPNVATVVALLSSAHAFIEKRRMITKLKQARQKYPTVQMVLILAGKSDPPLDDDIGRQILRSAGWPPDQSRVHVCETDDTFNDRATSIAQFVVINNREQARLDKYIKSLKNEEEGP